MVNYARIPPTHPQYQTIMYILELGGVACDALDHNADEGCPNPLCFKFRDRRGDQAYE